MKNRIDYQITNTAKVNIQSGFPVNRLLLLFFLLALSVPTRSSKLTANESSLTKLKP